jgi:hypothetical protein
MAALMPRLSLPKEGMKNGVKYSDKIKSKLMILVYSMKKKKCNNFEYFQICLLNEVDFEK